MGGGGGQKKLADQSAAQSTALAQGYSKNQQQLFNTLWGAPTSGAVPGGSGSASTGGSTGGALNQFLNPASLNVTSPTGAFKTANVNADTAAAAQAASNASNIKSGANNAGFGANSPSGFTQQQLNQNNQSLANSRGTNFTAQQQAQQQQALSNFWNTANLASSGAATGQAGALQGTDTAANTYANLYGTAASTSPLNATIGALGTAGGLAASGATSGAAACAAVGTPVRINQHTVAKIEQLGMGGGVWQTHGKVGLLLSAPEYSEAECVEVQVGDIMLTVSVDHTFLLPEGGYARADESRGMDLKTEHGTGRVLNVTPVGVKRVVRLRLPAPHTFLCSGVWCEE